ncbi:ABC transporter-related protein [Chloroherpeton thalassium ATCC 35110]|uniref:Cell division ATP-binding protein FtsE n=1 Tax=Chloroherpeton thalassium (strain ATCC 35110 / GB-78) TaxID=517418 RepID=B3QV84_CHLT3|nr:ATP-binding cassette domain-containing protein [Chloroherpeton thalassium]ACF13038.1 ABC transporter-related protein [Chloroherpeton thalassium ATCC 35110]
MITLSDVSLQLGRNQVFDHVDLQIERGELVYIVGGSGAGKSSLLRMLYMDLQPDSGSVQVGEFNSTLIKRSEIPYLRRHLGIVFQDFKLFDDRSVFENVAFVLEVTGVKRKLIAKKVSDALSEVGLSQKRNELPVHLSGGEQQRVVIARAIVSEPYVLLADEPTGNLDPDVAVEIMSLIKKINLRGITVLTVTHDYNLVKKIPARILQIKDGKIFDVQFKKNEPVKR